MTSSSGSSTTGPAPLGPKPSIKGIRTRLTLPKTPSPGRQRKRDGRDSSPPELPPPPRDLNELYAKVDRSKKKKNREGSESSSNPCSPMSDQPATLQSPTKTLIEKFNTLGQSSGQDVRRMMESSPSRPKLSGMTLVANPLMGGGSQESLMRPSSGQSNEPMYATIGSKNRSQIASRFSKPADKV